jgi:DNA-binding MarR family transcriptional regulator
MSDAKVTLQRSQMCAAGTLRRANRLVSRFYDQVLKPSGIRATQYTILAIVRGKGPIAVTQLADILVMDRTTLARDLQPLERDGLISLTTSKEDNRVRLVNLTETGQTTLQTAAQLWKKAQNHMIDVIGEDRLLHLISELQEVTRLVKE